MLCHRILVLPYLQALDTANAQIGAERDPQKQKSFIMSQICTQLLLSGESTMCAHWPLLPQQLVAVSRSELQWDVASMLQTSFWLKQMRQQN